MRPVQAALIALLLMLLALPAGAERFDLAIQTETKYDTNVEKTQSNSDNGFSFRLSPYAKLSSAEGRFSYELAYQPTVEVFANDRDNNALSHFANGKVGYIFHRKLRGSIRNLYRRVQALNQGLASDGSGDVEAASDIQRQTITINSTIFQLEQNFNPRWSGMFTSTYGIFEAEEDDVVDSQSISFNQNVNYQYNARNGFGAGGGLTFQFFDEISRRINLGMPLGGGPEQFDDRVQPGSETQVYRVYASWRRSFGEGTTFYISGGPAFIKSQQDNDGVSSSNVTFFGEVSARHQWSPNVRSMLRYTRDENNSGGLGGSSIADRVRGTTTWNPTERWTFTAFGEWFRRDAVSELESEIPTLDLLGNPTGSITVEQEGGLNSNRWSVGARASHRLTQRLSANLSLRYSDQDTQNATTGPSSFNSLLAIVGVRYDFDPMQF